MDKRIMESLEITKQYSLYDRECLPEHRELLISLYPALVTSPNAATYWRFVQYIFHSRFRDGANGKTVMRREIVAVLAGKHWADESFSAQKIMDQFEQDMFPLNYSTWSYSSKRARHIEPQYDPRVELSHRSQRSKIRLDKERELERVNLITGEYLGRRKAVDQQREYGAYLDELTLNPKETHPAFDLIKMLNAGSPRALKNVLRPNWVAMCQWVDALPENTELELRQKRQLECVLDDMHDFGIISRYAPADNTARIFAKGVNVNTLPRELRAVALNGTVDLDLRAAQLAICASPYVYNCPRLFAFLQTGESFWSHILEYLGLGAEFKPIIKAGLYPIIFGMGVEKYTQLLADGYLTERDRICKMQGTGLGAELTQKFLNHPFIQELVKARQKAFRAACNAGGHYDAFGEWLPMLYDYKADPRPHSLMASVAQSYELKIMLGMMPLLKQQSRYCSLVSFIHDGVYLKFKSTRAAESLVPKLKSAVAKEASALGIPTELE